MSKPFLADMAIEEVTARLDKISDDVCEAQVSFHSSRKRLDESERAFFGEQAKAKLTDALNGLKSLLGEE